MFERQLLNKEYPMNDHGLESSQQSRIDALKAKHAILASRLDRAQKQPGSADFYIKQLKKQKLLLKDKIEGMQERRVANSA